MPRHDRDTRLRMLRDQSPLLRLDSQLTISITISGPKPDLDTGGSAITSYQLRVSTNWTAIPLPISETDTEDAVISNLPGNRTEYTHAGVKWREMYFYASAR